LAQEHCHFRSTQLVLSSAAMVARRSFAAAARAKAALQVSPMKLVLVDGTAVLTAHFYSSQKSEMVNTKDEPIGAVHSFVTDMFLLQRRTSDITHFGVMWDSPHSDVQLQRQKELPGYKAHRMERPQGFWRQHTQAQEACTAFGWRVKAFPSIEADDLIHTYTKAALALGSSTSVLIATPDKDLLQLVSSRVKVCGKPTDSENEAFDAEKVEAKWGVGPEQFGDLLALCGDTSDGVPGVPGIGRKKAATLLKQHGSLIAVLNAAKNGLPLGAGVGEVLRGKLVEHADQAVEMRKLVALRWVEQADAQAFERELTIPELNSRWRDRALQFCKKENLIGLEVFLDVKR